MNVEENAIQKRKNLYFQLYSISMSGDEAAKRFTVKYGYAPEKILITGGGILAGPIKENHDEINYRG